MLYFKPTRKRRTNRTPRPVRPDPMYAQERGNDEVDPLTEAQTKELRIKPKGAGVKPWYIYMVRGWRDDGSRDDWHYEGRSYNCTHAITLDVHWLTGNEMGPKWRSRTFQKHQNFWFRVPVKTNLTSTEDCAPGSIMKFCNFVALDELTEKLRFHCRYGSSIGFCIDFLTRSKGFSRLKLKITNFDPLFPRRKDVLYLVQICSINTTNEDIDNTHAICIFGGLIFDVNHIHPLKLDKQNLDNCCLGGDSWVFHHVSKLAAFSPARKLLKKIVKDFASNYVRLYLKYEIYNH